jgi:hypothetical protein
MAMDAIRVEIPAREAVMIASQNFWVSLRGLDTAEPNVMGFRAFRLSAPPTAAISIFFCLPFAFRSVDAVFGGIFSMQIESTHSRLHFTIKDIIHLTFLSIKLKAMLNLGFPTIIETDSVFFRHLRSFCF